MNYVNSLKFPHRHATEARIFSFRNLCDGWHFGEGVEVSESVLNSALALHSKIVAAGFIRTDAFPGLDGEIRVTVYQETMYAEFTLEKHGKWTFVLEEGEVEKEYQEFLSFEEAVSKINLLHDICVKFEYFPGVIGIGSKSVLQAWLSNLHPAMDSFRYLIEIVPSEPTARSATILKQSIPNCPENLQFSGSSPQRYFQKELKYSPAEIQMTRAILT